LKVLRINAADTFQIRQQMLRPGQSIDQCTFTGDEDDQTFHLGAFKEGKLISVASFYFEKHPILEEPYQFRLRGMATLDEHQNKGLSRALLKTAFPIIKQNLCPVVWCNARIGAVGFYQKIGFEKTAEEFDIPGIGPHLLMFKSIK
jgi:predicted GNAT family N-acyltransferase